VTTHRGSWQFTIVFWLFFVVGNAAIWTWLIVFLVTDILEKPQLLATFTPSPFWLYLVLGPLIYCCFASFMVWRISKSYVGWNGWIIAARTTVMVWLGMTIFASGLLFLVLATKLYPDSWP